MSDTAWGNGRATRSSAVGALSPVRAVPPRDPQAPPAPSPAGLLLLITLIVVLYPFEYDFTVANYSLGDALVGPVAGYFMLRSLMGPVRWPKYMVQVLALVVIAIASSLVNAFTPAFFFSVPSALLETTKLFSAALWMCVTFWLLSEDFARRYFQLACCSAVLAAGFAVGSLWVTAQGTTDYRPTGPFDNTNLYASYLYFNVFLVLGTRDVLEELRRSGRPLPTLLRWLGALLGPVVMPLLLLGLLATASRGALLGCVVGLVVSGAWRPRRIPAARLAVVAIGAGFLIAVGTWYMGQNPLVLNRLESTAEGVGPNVENRLELWHAGLQALSENPVLGVGYGQLRNYVELATGNNKPVHQTFISIGAELGAVGLLAFLWLVAAVLRDTYPARSRNNPDVAQACRGLVIAALTQGLFTNIQHSRALWMVIGVLAVQAVEQRRTASGAQRVPEPPGPAPVWRTAEEARS